uniref:Putative secreted protein n=1 Tax=Anopheles darlingi TaxID=43151 RepID=A0A2M4D5L7_ANODA
MFDKLLVRFAVFFLLYRCSFSDVSTPAGRLQVLQCRYRHCSTVSLSLGTSHILSDVKQCLLCCNSFRMCRSSLASCFSI